MPSFAFHPINRISRSISSPNALASQQTKVVLVVTASRPRTGNFSPPAPSTNSIPDHQTHSPPSLETHSLNHNSHPSDSFTTAASDDRNRKHHPFQYRLSAPLSSAAMPRLNPLNLISAVTSSVHSHQHSESKKPPSPVSSSSTSSARDSLPIPSSYSRSSSYNGQTASHKPSYIMYFKDHSSRVVTDLPPMSPMSSMYDPHSPEVSADGSGMSDDDSGRSACLSNSSASDSLEGNVFLRPRSTHENRLKSNEVRGPVVNSKAPSRPHSRDFGPPVAFRRALFERHSSPAPCNTPGVFPMRSRESAFAGIAARGRVVDAFVASPQVPDITNPDDVAGPTCSMPRVMSGKSLEIPRGKVEQLPVPRPLTPCQVPRPETPSRLPRPRVFIKPSPSRHSMVDPVAVTRDSEMRPGEAEFVTREIPRPVTPSPVAVREVTAAPVPAGKIRSLQEDFYFSDEESVEDDISEYQLDQYTSATPTPSDVLSYKVRRAVSAIRSISFQSHNPDDVETAWGQANAPDQTRDRTNVPVASNKWRRVCGRISSKNGVQEYESRSEADAHSITSYNSSISSQRDRGVGGRDQLRGVIGVPLRGDHSSRQRRSLWTSGKRDRQQAPQTRAAELLLSNGQGLLAASADAYDIRHALTTVDHPEPKETPDRTRVSAKRCSVDKYVEFIHASAQRESRNRNQYKNLPSRIVNRMFRRRWN